MGVGNLAFLVSDRFYSLTIYFLRTDTIDRPDPNMPATDIYNKQCQTNM